MTQIIPDGIKEVLQKLNVKNLIISKQIEKNEECTEILKLSKERKTKVIVVKKGTKIKIDKNTYFDIFWPETNNLIEENGINNNSIVAKLTYGNFKMLFTGDIEQITEEQILNNKIDLNSTILKVAHHGSKTSSIESFITCVNPKIALIGVRKK